MSGDFNFESAPGLDLFVNNFETAVIEIGRNAPQTVIQDTQAWLVNVEWEVQGLMVAFTHGTWLVDVYVEAIGQGNEQKVGTASAAMGAASYNLNIPVPAGTPGVAAGEESTPYKVVITLTAKDLGGFRYPMAGYIEGPVLQFYRLP